MWEPQLWPDIVYPNRLGGMMQPARAAHGAFPARPSWEPRKAGWLCGERRSSVVIELSCLHGSERYAACFDEVVARAVRFSQPAVLSALLVIQLFGIVIPPPYFPQRAPKGALRPFSVATLLHYFSWCASEYFVVGRISCYASHNSAQTNVCQRCFLKKHIGFEKDYEKCNLYYDYICKMHCIKHSEKFIA